VGFAAQVQTGVVAHGFDPVHVRDMLLRKKLTADKSLELNRLFVEYQKFFGETQKLGKEILGQLTG